MIKITIEVNEGFFAEASDPKNMEVLLKEKKIDGLGAFANMLSFGLFDSIIKKGNKEFKINPENIKDANEIEIFNNMMRNISILIIAQETRSENGNN